MPRYIAGVLDIAGPPPIIRPGLLLVGRDRVPADHGDLIKGVGGPLHAVVIVRNLRAHSGGVGPDADIHDGLVRVGDRDADVRPVLDQIIETLGDRHPAEQHVRHIPVIEGRRRLARAVAEPRTVRMVAQRIEGPGQQLTLDVRADDPAQLLPVVRRGAEEHVSPFEPAILTARDNLSAHRIHRRPRVADLVARGHLTISTRRPPEARPWHASTVRKAVIDS